MIKNVYFFPFCKKVKVVISAVLLKSLPLYINKINLDLTLRHLPNSIHNNHTVTFLNNHKHVLNIWSFKGKYLSKDWPLLASVDQQHKLHQEWQWACKYGNIFRLGITVSGYFDILANITKSTIWEKVSSSFNNVKFSVTCTIFGNHCKLAR